MSPEERRLLAELFERTREAAAHPRDKEAEALIAEMVRAQPAAPYLLAQAVLVQDQALQSADQQMQEMQAYIDDLEAYLHELESQQNPRGQGQYGRWPQDQGPYGQDQYGRGDDGRGPQGPGPQGHDPYGRPRGGFLGGSAFGGGEPPPPRGSVPPSGGVWGSGRTLDPSAAAPQGGVWPGQQRPAEPTPEPGQPPQQQGGFLKGALTTAAGVAGGMLLANSIKGLFGGQNDPLGMSSAKASEGGYGQGGGYGGSSSNIPSPGGSGGSITDGVPGFPSSRGPSEAELREQDRLQDEDQDQDLEQDEEIFGEDADYDDGGDEDDEE